MSTSDGERSPKRQRLESYSPASPQPTVDTRHFVPPQTPPPSVRMSPSWTAQTLPAQPTGSGTSTTFPTPPSTAGYLGHMAGRGAGSEGGGESGHQTPAGEDEGYARRDHDGDAEMTDRPESGNDGVSSVDAEHRRTDHEREGAGGDITAPVPGAGVLYKLSTAPIAISRPHPSQDLIQLYDLKRIQAAVARRDPVTGEKINVLRKSYANKVKKLGLEGLNKAQSNLHELEGLLDPMWNNDAGNGATLWENHCEPMRMDKADVQEDLLNKLDDALRMKPGRLPAKEHEQWKSMLGLDEAIAPAVATKGGNTPNAAKLSGTSAFAKTSPGTGARNSAPASPRSLSRPDRSNKRRRYDDTSYEGYQQGFEDDGYSTGGVDDTGRRGSGVKRQKRKDFASSANSPAFTNGSGSNGMVGVRSS
ncbi:hypothetical protein TI39_contig4114g00003 [Zymoseptoria brevis]|uniref:Mediator of RNA polymerase II transcription subunit 19 n=1 Tax=Zymoseptoria brevis TaxID=1047168 RepID=A0A0F4GEN3_9PEZI|nr:hypothetical protein TI39_contig4114g00003 [Zymoseptoria brevis]